MNKQIILLLFFTFYCFISFAQGINFSQEKSFAEIKEKAKKERKYLFVDVGATWCVPCYLMEKQVLSKESVGDFFNDQFISIKIQADSTKADGEIVKARYAAAKEILKTYNIVSYPTYLFISPDGRLAFRGTGSKKEAEFISLAKQALLPVNSLADRIALYKDQKMSLAQKRVLAMNLGRMGDYKYATEVAMDYKENYLDVASEQEMADSANIKFLYQFQSLIKPGDGSFLFLYAHAEVMDKVVEQKGYASRMINLKIAEADVRKFIYKDKLPLDLKPDWNTMESVIAGKYGIARAHKIILYEKKKWYVLKKDWEPAVKYGMEDIQTPFLDTAGESADRINDFVHYDLLQHTQDKRLLNKGMQWIKLIVRNRPRYYDGLDTYAQLLYKLGKKEKAIAMQKNTISMIEADNPSDKVKLLQNFSKTLAKMEADSLIWKTD